jgi:hypothetical protein
LAWAERIVMRIEIGNADALDASTDANGEMVFNNIEGERVTTFEIPEGHTSLEAFQIVLAGLPRLINPTARPWWIECDDGMVQTLLLDHFGLPRTTTRPVVWGDGTTTMPKLEAIKKGRAKKPTTAGQTEGEPT